MEERTGGRGEMGEEYLTKCSQQVKEFLPGRTDLTLLISTFCGIVLTSFFLL